MEICNRKNVQLPVLRFLCLMAFICLSTVVKAQNPVAEFTGNRLSGCAPLTVTFTDQSTGNPRFWNWELGNGQLSTQQNPTTTYSTPGVYEVTLVVRNATGTNGITKTGYITVNPSPRANFTQSGSIGCLPTTFRFTDQSTSPNGSITSWEWNFGDGTTSNEKNPSHEYTIPGYYSVSLKVTDSAGCSHTITRSRTVRVVNGVVADFNTTGPATCRPPFTVNFKNETSGPGSISYSWDFGNGSSSTEPNPAFPYTDAGTYTVNLLATSEFGCSDTIQKQVVISGISTSFNSIDTSCINTTIDFQNSSAQTPVSTAWFVNDSLFSNQLNSSLYFTNPGTYRLKMVNQYAECPDSSVKNIVIVGKPVVDFTAGETVSCRAPFTVSFQDQTPNAASWLWDFGDGNTSTAQNPQHIYQTAGIFDVRLRVTDIYGCEDTLSKQDFISIVAPAVSISNAPAGGCIPFTFRPIANVTSIDGVASYSWNFGNGTTATGAAPTATYPNTGTYHLSLTITTNGGCQATTTVNNGVRTGTPPAPGFDFAPPNVCADGTVSFTNTSASADSYRWDFGDEGSSTERNPTYRYNMPGNYNITLTAFNNGCPRPITKGPVTIAPPAANFSYRVDCTNDLLNVNFINESVVDATKPPLTYLWSFGDPANSTDTRENPSFKYPALGTYTVTLTVTNDTCTNTFSREITLLNEEADFSLAKNPVCAGEPINLSAIKSDENNIRNYRWQIGSDTPFNDERTINPRINTAGVYDLRLTITDLNGCQSAKTVQDFITVLGPRARFAVSRNEVCANTSVNFTDQSVSASAITKWTFDFGDSTITEFTSPPFTHTYTDTGFFAVRLTVTDANGCSHSFRLNNAVYVSKPTAYFSKDTTRYCPGFEISFTDSSSGRNLSYLWNFGDNSTSTDQNPSHTFSNEERSYTISLRVEDKQGCSDSLVRTDYITIVAPKPAFDVSDTMTMCPPLETRFTFKAADYGSYYWDFGDGSDISLLENPRHFYNSYGTFAAKLYVTGPGGCIDSATRYIYIQRPGSTVFNYSPLSACNELNVDFAIEPPSSASFIFNFGDGSRDTTGSKTFSHFYKSPGTYQPSIFLTDNTGCQVTVSGPSRISIIGAQPLFGIDESEFCDTGTVYFTNFTVGNDPVVNTLWNFGDGTTSTNPDAIHRYTTPGVYIPSLTVTTQRGCTDVITDTVRIYRTPVASIQGKDTICIHSPEIFSAILAQPDTSTVQYTWFINGSQQATSRDISFAANQPGNIPLRLDTKIAFGCASTISHDVYAVPLPGILFGPDPVVFSGSGTDMPVTYTGPITNYNWSPPTGLSCDNCPVPYAAPKKTTEYTLRVTDSYGCTSSDTVTVFVVCSDQNLFVPNTFSPNGDGRNDQFYPRGAGLIRIKSFRIFNRWGETVYEKINFNANQSSEGWDGRYKGKVAESDVYVYTMEVVCENGETFSHKGNVMLLK